MDTQENIGPPLAAINFSPYNKTSFNSAMLSPTTLSAQVVAEVFPTSQARPSRRFTSAVAAGSALDGSGRWYNCPETPMIFCDSPLSRYCTGHCRTNDLYHQQLESLPSDKADVVRRFLQIGLVLCTHLIKSRARRFVSRLLKIPNVLGILQKEF